MTSPTLLIYCTCPDRPCAERIAQALVEQRKAACASLLPGLTSIYRWQGRIEQSEEVLLTIKTTAPAYPAVEQAIRELHPYELPEIIAVPVERGLPGYIDWISQCIEE